MSDYEDKIKKLEKKVFEFFMLSKLGKSLVSLHEINELAKVFVSSVYEASGAENAALILFDAETENYKYAFSVGLKDEKLGEICFKKKEGMLWQVLHGGDPFPIRDKIGRAHV